VLLHHPNGNFLPVEYTRSQAGLNIDLFKDPREVFNLSGTGGGNDRDGDVFTKAFYKFNVKAIIGTILVNTVE